MLILAIALSQAAAPAAGSEAQDLGVRLARTSGLAVMAPALIEKDLGELVKEDASLNPEERDRLLRLGHEQARAGLERLVHAIGAGYAKHLSVGDLRLLVAEAESPAAARWRAAEPAVIAEATAAIGSLDLKKDTAAAFCRETGKLCGRR